MNGPQPQLYSRAFRAYARDLAAREPCPWPPPDPATVVIPVASHLLWFAKIAHVEDDWRLPHSRACGWHWHQHGLACSTNCPTCHGR